MNDTKCHVGYKTTSPGFRIVKCPAGRRFKSNPKWVEPKIFDGLKEFEKCKICEQILAKDRARLAKKKAAEARCTA